jgi:DsbC/DsbD-like thiol-disulfide interchange protein
MTAIVPMRAALGFAATCLASAVTIEARAEDASPWQRDGHSAVRLLAGSRTGTVLLGGIAFQLQPGWKTYWRTPGDSGVPPRFDFSKSENVEAVTVLWPAPAKFEDGAGGYSFGYRDQIVMPLRIVPKNADKSVRLRAAIDSAFQFTRMRNLPSPASQVLKTVLCPLHLTRCQSRPMSPIPTR